MTFDDFKNREFRDVLEGMFDAMRDGSHLGGPAMWCDGRRRAVEACDRALARIGDHMARPMGADAARYVEVFEGREHVTEQDVRTALAAYGSDHMAARRIIDHAHELGLMGFDATEDERIHYGFELVRDACSRVSFKGEGGPVEEREGYGLLKVAACDWGNWLQGYESILGSKAGPLRVPREEVGA